MKTSRLFSKGRRGSLPKGCESWLNVPPSLKKILLSLDAAIELIHYKRKYYLYRVIYRGGVSSDDTLIKEFQLQAPPGAWLVEHLAAHDSYKRKGDKMSWYWRGVLDFDLKKDKEDDRKLGDIIHTMKGDFIQKAKDRKVICLR